MIRKDRENPPNNEQLMIYYTDLYAKRLATLLRQEFRQVLTREPIPNTFHGIEIMTVDFDFNIAQDKEQLKKSRTSLLHLEIEERRLRYSRDAHLFRAELLSVQSSIDKTKKFIHDVEKHLEKLQKYNRTQTVLYDFVIYLYQNTKASHSRNSASAKEVEVGIIVKTKPDTFSHAFSSLLQHHELEKISIDYAIEENLEQKIIIKARCVQQPDNLMALYTDLQDALLYLYNQTFHDVPHSAEPQISANISYNSRMKRYIIESVLSIKTNQ